MVVVADESFIRNRLLGNGQVLATWPSFNVYRDRLIKLDAACSTCRSGQAAKKERSEMFDEIRDALWNMSAEDIVRLKQLVGSPQASLMIVRVVKQGEKSVTEGKTV